MTGFSQVGLLLIGSMTGYSQAGLLLIDSMTEYSRLIKWEAVVFDIFGRHNVGTVVGGKIFLGSVGTATCIVVRASMLDLSNLTFLDKISFLSDSIHIQNPFDNSS